MDPGTVEFVRRAIALKDVARKGWKKAGIQRPESVADHSWGVAILALAVADAHPALDRRRLLELAIAHDLCEVVVGDLVPGEYADRAEKLARERAGLETLVETAPLPLRRLMMDRFEELATDASDEARLVHQLDKLEMAFQAERYAMQGVPAADLAPFHASAAAAVRDGRLRSALASLNAAGSTR